MYFLDLQLLLQCSPRTVCPTFHSFLLASFSKKNPFLLVMNRCNGFFSCRSTTTPDFYIATRPTRYGDSTLKEKLVNSDIHTYIHIFSLRCLSLKPGLYQLRYEVHIFCSDDRRKEGMGF